MKTLIAIMCLAASVSFGRVVCPGCLPCTGSGCSVNRPANAPQERTVAVIEAEIAYWQSYVDGLPVFSPSRLIIQFRIARLEAELAAAVLNEPC